MAPLTEKEKALRAALGAVLKAAREAAGFESIRKAARAAEVTHPYVAQIEHGLRSPSVHIIGRLARAYRTPLLTILRRAGYR